MIKKSFTLRVLVISFLVLALPLLVDSFIFFQDAYHESIKETKSQLMESGHLKAFSLAEIQPIKQVLLRELDFLFDIGEKLENQEYAALTDELTKTAHLEGENHIYVLALSQGDQYHVLASNTRSLVDTYFTSHIRLHQVQEEGEGSFIRYQFSEAEQTDIPYLFLARVVKDESGQPMGMIMASAEVRKALNEIVEKHDRMDNIQFALLNADGIVFAATDPYLEGEYFEPLTEDRKGQVLEVGQIGLKTLPRNPLPVIHGNNPPFFEFIFNDQIQIAYRTYVPHLGISVVAYASKEVFFGKAVQHFLLIYMIYGLILIIGGGVAYWLSLWISRPLRQLSYLMKEVRKGNLSVRFHEEPLGFEINLLGRIFNHTIDVLLENIQKVEDERVKKETYQRELAIGREVQRSLLPSSIPRLAGAEVAGTYLPALEVGGDFYGYFSKKNQLGEEVLFLIVADPAEKGISSCLYSLSARSLFRSYGMLYDDLGEILTLTNNAFMYDTADSGMFVTAVVAMFHPGSKKLTYFSCGHVPAIIQRANGRLVVLEQTGLALGLKSSTHFQTEDIQLEPGDMLILYTDGLLQAVNEKHQQFSMRQLQHVLQTRHWQTAQETVDGIAAEIQSFTQRIPQEEEIIIVALKCL